MMNHVQKATLHSASSVVAYKNMEKSLALLAASEAATSETTLNKFGEGDAPSDNWDNCPCVGPLSGSEIEEAATKGKTQQQVLVLYCSTISGQDANMTVLGGFARPPQSATEEHQQESSPQTTTRSQHDHPRSRHLGDRCTFEGKEMRRHAAVSIVDLPAGETCHPEIAAAVHFTGRKLSSHHHDQHHPHIRRDLPRHHHSKKIKCAPTAGEGSSWKTKMYSSSLSPSEQVALARRRARRRASLTSICEQSCLETQEFFKRNANILGEKSDMEKLTREQQDPAKATSEEQEISLSELAEFLLSTLLTTASDKGHFSSNATSSHGDEKRERRRPEELVEGLRAPIRDAAYRSRMNTA
jgi:hypothetical protein